MTAYGSQWAWDNANPYDDDDEVSDIDVIDDVLPNIKAIILLDIEQGFTALEIIKDLSWLWVHITDSSVNRWCRAINNAVNRVNNNKVD